MNHPYDAVIIGAGLAGLTTAAVLASRENKKVLVVEKEGHVSGRCISFTGTGHGLALQEKDLTVQEFKSKLASAFTRVVRSEPDLETIFSEGLCDGYTFEAGGHATFWGNRGKVACILDYLGKHVDLPGNEGFAVIDPEQEGLFPLTKGGRFSWMSDESNRIAKEMLKEMALATPDDLKEWDKISFGEWMRQRTNDRKVYEFLAAVASIHMVMGEPDMIPAGDFIQFMNSANKIGMNLISGSTGVVPKPGFILLAEVLAESVIENGGEILLESAVEEVLIVDQKARGVRIRTKDGIKEIAADTVVCTALPKMMLNIIPSGCLPQEFADHIKNDFWSPGMITGYVGMRRNIVEAAGLNPKSWLLIPSYIKAEEGFIGDVDDISILPSAFSPTLAPEGKSTFAFSIALTEHEINDPSKVDRVIDEALRYVRRTFPTWDEDVEWALFTGSATGFGHWPPVGETRPANKCPWIDGLFFAGDCYGATVRGSGMDAAVHSAVACVDSITGRNYIEAIFPPYHR